MRTGKDYVDFDIRGLRHSMRVNQVEFWGKLGVTQSGGSRYENDGCIPKPVMLLIETIYIKGVDITLLNDRNTESVKAMISGGVNEDDVTRLSQTLQDTRGQLDKLTQRLFSIKSELNTIFGAM